MQGCSALGLLPHWSSHRPVVVNLPDELVHSNLAMSQSLVDLPKGSPVLLHSRWLASHPCPSLPLP